MSDKLLNVLFICTDNSARSIFAENIINRLGKGKFQGFSAGITPAGVVDEHALVELSRHNYLTDNLQTQSWSDFGKNDSPEMDYIFTLSDTSIDVQAPQWPGEPMVVHWGMRNPAEVEGSQLQKQAAYARSFNELNNRISIFVNLPLESLDKLKLRQKLEEMHKPEMETA